MGVGGRLGAAWTRLTGGLSGWFAALRRRHARVDRLVRAGGRYQRTKGDYLAAAITYFSFLALFPLILLSVSVAGFVLVRNPSLLDQLVRAIRDAVPGQVGGTLVQVVDSAIHARGTIGVVGLLGTLYAGLGWVSNVRTASQLVWNVPEERSYLRQKLGDLGVLVGLGLAIAASFALTLAGTVATGWFVDAAGLDGVTGVGVAARILGMVLAVAGDTVVFTWLFVRLPRRRVPYRDVVSGALFAAVGLEVLKVLGTFYARQVSHGTTGGIFGNVIGLLVWLNLFARFLLFAMAWTATAEEDRAGTPPAGLPGPWESPRRDPDGRDGGRAARITSGPALAAPPRAAHRTSRVARDARSDGDGEDRGQKITRR